MTIAVEWDVKHKKRINLDSAGQGLSKMYYLIAINNIFFDCQSMHLLLAINNDTFASTSVILAL